MCTNNKRIRELYYTSNSYSHFTNFMQFDSSYNNYDNYEWNNYIVVDK
jgi:hypothetical protein